MGNVEMVEIGGAEGMEKSEGHNSVRDSGNVAEGEWLFLWYRRTAAALGVLPRLKRLRTAAESAGTEVYAALADIGNVAELEGTEVYAARSWQTGR